ncbi:hypothetical protein AVEN_169601-1 [Araneus ventricosus]|uniref:Uncharacterized protein n=1 Tax=Araneus ventricosus TaxID=182803 RepID=A0A4Y2HPT7_ARAVE|nr:hypothetical protein AVEN_169601-1 [Araneus ventricosus]
MAPRSRLVDELSLEFAIQSNFGRPFVGIAGMSSEKEISGKDSDNGCLNLHQIADIGTKSNIPLALQRKISTSGGQDQMSSSLSEMPQNYELHLKKPW